VGDFEEGVVPGVAEDQAADTAESVDCTGYHGGWASAGVLGAGRVAVNIIMDDPGAGGVRGWWLVAGRPATSHLFVMMT
jgi:hypothetical protein